MKPYPFNNEQKKWIEKNYKKVKAQYIAEKYGVKRYQVYSHIMKFGLDKKKKSEKKEEVNDGYFRVEKRTIWI